MPPRSLKPTDRAECFLTLGSAPFSVRGTDAEQTLHSRCVDVEASGRCYTVIKNSVIACGLFPPRSLFPLFLLPPEAQSLLALALFFCLEKTTSLFICCCCFYPFYFTRVLASAVKYPLTSFSSPIYIPGSC